LKLNKKVLSIVIAAVLITFLSSMAFAGYYIITLFGRSITADEVTHLDNINNMKKYRVKKVDSLEIFDESKFDDFSIDDESKIESSLEAITEYLEKKGYLPEGAEFDSISTRESIPIQASDAQQKTEVLKNYVINYRQNYNGKKVSTLHKGSYLNVYIEDGKITGIIKN
jgi:hypothetical protein